MIKMKIKEVWMRDSACRGGRMSEDRHQMPDARGQWSEVGSRFTEGEF